MPNQMFILASLVDSAGELEQRLGNEWPSVRDELISLLFELDSETIASAKVRRLDVVLERLLASPAAAIARRIMRSDGTAALRGFTSCLTATAVEANVPVSHLLIPVFFATDRHWTEAGTAGTYSGDRGSLEFGIARVSVPVRHRLGEIEGPQWWRLQFRPDQTKHVTSLGITRLEHEDFAGELRRSLLASGDPDLLLFIHGYNVTFDQATHRTAQIVRDLKFRGQAVLYSWPSRGDPRLYPADEATIEASVPHLESFLRLLISKTEARCVHVLAHSMGNRALLRVLQALDPDKVPVRSSALGEVVFAAPDVDRDVFANGIKSSERRAQRLTLYASSNDLAIRASKLLHQFPRAGEAGERLFVVPGIDTIDASRADTSLFGLRHSYFSNQRTILNDLHGAILNRLPPDGRFDLESATSNDGHYWLYRE